MDRRVASASRSASRSSASDTMTLDIPQYGYKYCRLAWVAEESPSAIGPRRVGVLILIGHHMRQDGAVAGVALSTKAGFVLRIPHPR